MKHSYKQEWILLFHKLGLFKGIQMFSILQMFINKSPSQVLPSCQASWKEIPCQSDQVSWVQDL